MNYPENTDNEDYNPEVIYIPIFFFVEADISKGLFIRREDRFKKLLENGRAVTATNDGTRIVYFAADDGLYKYNPVMNTAEKYGTVTDSLIAIA